MRRSLALIAPLAVLATACGSSTSSSSSGSAASTLSSATSTLTTAASTPTAPSTSTTSASTAKPAVALSTRTLPGVGSVLVNGQGRTLYVFVPDRAKRVTCTGSCAAVWPPLAARAGQKPSLAVGVKASLVSSDSNPSGGSVVTYAGWPLYLYVADRKPGTDHGQGINSSGGLWYVIAPSGKVVKSNTSPGGSGKAGGGGYSSGGAGY